MTRLLKGGYFWCEDFCQNLKYNYRDYRYSSLARRPFQSHPPSLGDTQSRVARDLADKGIASVNFHELFRESLLWSQLCQRMEEFVGSEKVRTGVHAYRSKETPGTAFPTAIPTASKDFLLRLHDRQPVIPTGDLWLRVGMNPVLLDVINAYLGMWSKLYYLDLWYVIPTGSQGAPSASQRWHRDPEDRKLVKVFLYFSEVDHGAGPLQYIPGSRRSAGPYQHLWGKRHQAYPAEEELEKAIPSSQWTTCLAQPGTMVLCDTTGFHRGGHATETARLSATWTYVTPAAFLPRRFSVHWEENHGLSPEAIFALT